MKERKVFPSNEISFLRKKKMHIPRLVVIFSIGSRSKNVVEEEEERREKSVRYVSAPAILLDGWMNVVRSPLHALLFSAKSL